MNLARFSDQGIAEFRHFLQSCKHEGARKVEKSLLTQEPYIEDLGVEFPVPDGPYKNRLDMAASVEEVLCQVAIPNDLEDIGLWAWLSASLFDTVCPLDRNGARKPGKEYRHVPTSGFRDFYRHLVRGPVRIYRLYKQNPDDARIVLCQPPSSPGDYVEQLASRQERLTSPAIIGCATRLYFDEGTGRPKSGEAPNAHKSGTLRRYLDVLDQLELTYDLYSISPEELIEILPSDFDRLKS